MEDDFMSNILPVSNLKTYEDYEREKAEKKLLMKLQEAEETVKDGNGWMTLDELKTSMGE